MNYQIFQLTKIKINQQLFFIHQLNHVFYNYYLQVGKIIYLRLYDHLNSSTSIRMSTQQNQHELQFQEFSFIKFSNALPQKDAAGSQKRCEGEIQNFYHFQSFEGLTNQSSMQNEDDSKNQDQQDQLSEISHDQNNIFLKDINQQINHHLDQLLKSIRNPINQQEQFSQVLDLERKYDYKDFFSIIWKEIQKNKQSLINKATKYQRFYKKMTQSFYNTISQLKSMKKYTKNKSKVKNKGLLSLKILSQNLDIDDEIEEQIARKIWKSNYIKTKQQKLINICFVDKLKQLKSDSNIDTNSKGKRHKFWSKHNIQSQIQNMQQMCLRNINLLLMNQKGSRQ